MAKFRILSLDGGGIRGALTINLLKKITQSYSNLIEETQLFAGTSTGSLIALGLAYGLTIEEIEYLYSEENGKYIFSSNSFGLLRPKYNLNNLKTLLLKIFPKNLRLVDLNHYVVIPSFRVNGSQSQNWSPVFFNNFPDSKNKNISVINAALSSSAAPIYFPSHNHHIDGGVIANNPCMAALALAIDPYYANKICDEISLFSIGTGFNAHKITEDTTKWGLLQWLLKKKPPLAIQTIMFDGAIEADSYFCYQFLKNNFYRLNPELHKSIALDDFREIPYLTSLAEGYDISQVLTWLNTYWASTKPSPLNNNNILDMAKAKYWHNLHNKGINF